MSSRTRKILSLASSEGEVEVQDPIPVSSCKTAASSSPLQVSQSPHWQEPRQTLPQSSSTLKHKSPSPQPSTSKAATRQKETITSYFSSSESEPYQDSEDSYRPSENESENDLLGKETLDEEDTSSDSSAEDDIPGITANSEQWGPCTNSLVNDFQFTGQGGLKVPDMDLSKPFGIYKHFLTDEILDIIVLETNRYAAQLISAKPIRPRSLLHNWMDTTKEEIQKFLAILLLMGINKLPKMRLYWSTKDMYSNVFIKKLMTRNRFEVLLRCLHFSNNNDPAAQNDRLFKTKNILNLCCKQFQNTLEPNQEIVIDETMIPWRGRLVFRQYLPAKSHKYGVKIYKVCTPEGYTYDLKVYAGKNDASPLRANKTGHTYQGCMELLANLKNCGRILYVDNFYTSVALCKDLIGCQTNVCGTLRHNKKGNPGGVTKKKIKKGEVYGEENSCGIRVIKWVDKRPVLMLSSVPDHTDRLVPTGKKNRKGEDNLKPPAIIAYNNAKKGVDISDQMSSYYPSLRKSLKWYRKVVFELLLGTCVVNAWVLYNSYGTYSKMNMLHFREKNVEGLITSTDTEVEEAEVNTPAPVNENEQRIKKRKRGKSTHRLAKYEGTARKNRRRCAQCYKNIQQEKGTKEARVKATKVLTFCEDCENQPTMCLPCFKKFHD